MMATERHEGKSMPVWNPINIARSWRSVVLLASALLLLATVLPAGAATVGGNCVTTATKFRTSNANAGTTSTAFSTIPQSGVNFAQGGAGAGCIIVTFTSIITTASTWMYVKPTLDGNDPVDPGSGVWRVTSQESRTAVFVFTNVTPGAHTIVMKFRSNNGGSNVTVYNRIVTVTYRK
jgi:hypothetical protein